MSRWLLVGPESDTAAACRRAPDRLVGKRLVDFRSPRLNGSLGAVGSISAPVAHERASCGAGLTLGALARWGYEWAWSTPRSSEAIDVGAIFRLAPDLLHQAHGPRGTVELNVSDGNEGGETASYTLTATGERIAIQERPADRADARSRATRRRGWPRCPRNTTAAG